MIDPLLLGLIATIAVFVIGFPLPVLLQRLGLLDRPNTRSSHSKPTARGGGLAMIVTLVALLPVATYPSTPWIFLLSLAAVGLVSFWDDVRSLKASTRFLVHLGAAAAWVCATVLIYRHAVGSIPAAHLLALSLAGIFLLVAYTNAFNFMDGINGLAAMQAACTGFGTAALGLAAGESPASFPVAVGSLVACSALGFLPHNFPRARMFMGDVGSAPTGFALAAAAFWLGLHHGFSLTVGLVLLHANFILDTGLTLVRRIWKGERWQQSHREHFYQRLVRSGYSHTKATCIAGALQFTGTLALAINARSGFVMLPLLAAGITAAWIGFYFFCDTRFRHAMKHAQPADPPR